MPHICSRNSITEIENIKKGDLISKKLSIIGHKVKRKNMTSGLNIIWRGNSNNWIGSSDLRREGVAIGN